jgi:hypothetical protein
MVASGMAFPLSSVHEVPAASAKNRSAAKTTDAMNRWKGEHGGLCLVCWKAPFPPRAISPASDGLMKRVTVKEALTGARLALR